MKVIDGEKQDEETENRMEKNRKMRINKEIMKTESEEKENRVRLRKPLPTSKVNLSF